jgi:hypothetical protein
MPLQIVGVDGDRNFEHLTKTYRKGEILPPPSTHITAIIKW